MKKVELVYESSLLRAAALLALRAWKQEFDAGRLERGSLAALWPGTTPEDQESLRRDVFGAPDECFWIGFDGDAGYEAEKLCAVTGIEALEVSLGLSSGEGLEAFVQSIATSSGVEVDACVMTLELASGGAVAPSPDQQPLRRDLPIDLYWLCEMPLFEAYVSWNSRQVTVVLTAPAIETPMFTVPAIEGTAEEAKRTAGSGLLVVQTADSELGPQDRATIALLSGSDYGAVPVGS